MKADKMSKKEISELAKRLRYMDPKNIAKDFKSARERAAVRAVFEWLSLNAICAWSTKPAGTYSTTFMSKEIRRGLGTIDAIVLPEDQYEKARKVLALDKPPYFLSADPAER